MTVTISPPLSLLASPQLPYLHCWLESLHPPLSQGEGKEEEVLGAIDHTSHILHLERITHSAVRY